MSNFTDQQIELLIDAVWMRQRCFIAGDKRFREYFRFIGTIYETKPGYTQVNIDDTWTFLLWFGNILYVPPSHLDDLKVKLRITTRKTMTETEPLTKGIVIFGATGDLCKRN